MTARRHRSGTATGGLTALTAGVILLVLAAFVAPAAAATTPTPYEGNPSCADLGFDDGYKIDRQPTDGVYVLQEDRSITIANVAVDTVDKQVFFDWSTSHTDETPFLVNTVLVKFADGGLRYDYGTAGTSGDTGLYSTKDSISHVDFCWIDPTTPSSDTVPTSDTTPTSDTVPTSDTTPTSATTPTVPPTVLPSSVVQPTQATTAESVLGVQIERQLPMTGGDNLLLAEVGFGLVLTGIMLLAYENRRYLTNS